MVWVSTLLFAGVVAGVVAAITVMFRGANLPGDQQIAEQGPVQPRTPAGPVARLIRVSDCVWSGEIKSPSVGDDLVTGRKLVLKSGLAEFVFRNGAKTIVEGPAVCEFSSSASVGLSRGKCAVTVEEPSARGFTVETPGMTYTDLGTEFGVKVADNAQQEVHVFRGKVRAEQGDGAAKEGRQGAGESQAPPAAIKGFPALLLSAHEAIRVAAPDASGRPAKTFERIAADEKQFVRIVREPFTLFNTGTGLDRRSQDARWTITSISTDPAFTPQPAFVVDWEASDKHSYAATDSRRNGQWIAISPTLRDMPPRCRMTYRTEFDLGGYDPATAYIEGRFAVDDYLIEMRVNGEKAALATRGSIVKLNAIRVDRGFVAGRNSIELVVENSGGAGSPMGLCVQWKGAAQRESARPPGR